MDKPKDNDYESSLSESLETKLMSENWITPAQFLKAKDYQKQAKKSLYASLVKLGYLKEDDIFAFFAKHADVPFVRLTDYKINRELINMSFESLYREQVFLPLFKIDNYLYIAMANPLDSDLVNTLGMQTGLDVQVLFACPSQISQAIDEIFGPNDKYYNIEDLIFSPSALNLIGFTRESERLSINTPLEFKVQDARVSLAFSSYISASALDISRNARALGLKTMVFLPPQAKIAVKFPKKYISKDIPAEVVHCRTVKSAEYLLGVKLLEVDDDFRKKIIEDAIQPSRP